MNGHLEQAIGQRMRERRIQLGMTQQSVAQAVGEHLGREWNRQTVFAAEKGLRAFAASELVAIGAALGMTVLQLLGEPATATPELRDAAQRLMAHADELARIAALAAEDARRLKLAALGCL